jgi:hypothetical protein
VAAELHSGDETVLSRRDAKSKAVCRIGGKYSTFFFQLGLIGTLFALATCGPYGLRGMS